MMTPQQAVRSFIELIHLNRALRARIESIPRDEQAMERVVRLAGRYGYRFDAAQLEAVLRSPSELTEAELEAAAGGSSGCAGPVGSLLRSLSEG
jgi:predicted ribosomally synthesized peptide with nif11-like leader